MKVKPRVELIAYTPDPEKVVASAAKLCYSDSPANEIMNDLDDEATERFLNMLMSFGHASPIEHASFTFAIEGVSRALTHQLVRHRLASFSQKSQRYVNENQFNYIIPPEIEENPEAAELFDETMAGLQKSYDDLSELLTESHTKKFIEQGFDENEARKKAEKLANEDARFVLPNACETMIVVTMNARELLHFFNVRTCNRAQWEIRELAKEMLKQAYEVAPTIFENAGPGCLTGVCPEGNMSCGKAKEVREEFSRLKTSDNKLNKDSISEKN